MARVAARRAALRTAGSWWRSGEVSSTSTPARLARPATAMPWRCGGRGGWRSAPPLPRSGSPPVPSMTRPSSRSSTRAPAPVQRGGHRGEAVAFLDAQLVEAAGDGAALRQRGGDEQHRELVDHARGEGGVDLDAGERRVAHAQVGDRLAADFARGSSSSMLPPIWRSTSIEPGAGRVEADVLDHEVAAGHDQRGDGEERGRGGIAGHLDGLRLAGRPRRGCGSRARRSPPRPTAPRRSP